ncbi:DUF333 domain-containing protein [Sphingomonas sp. BT-65]|uniref:putative hemolysin n=1 Tax=Sphingomonas sp. BT-65 TaxID=2989821 RepID=UPI002235CBBE|nr:DUF333 domain-containing protein [Sphingomonas sp. BT-65]MCW4461339.1 DUF333 domain-containing protein [Sphingomonas sp. BT-65]
MKRVVLMLPFALMACTPKPADTRATGMANPASVHCVEVGGRVEIRKEAGGATGYCHLPDGRVIEEWTLFRSAEGKNN